MRVNIKPVEKLVQECIEQARKAICTDCIVDPICSYRCEDYAAKLKINCSRIIYRNGEYILDPQFYDYNDGVGLQLCGGQVFGSDGNCYGHIDPPGPRGQIGVIGEKK